MIIKLAAIGLSIIFLLILILRFKWPAFLALLVIAMLAGLGLGLAPEAVIQAVREGMGGTLGFIAIVVGLGTMIGALLENAGGVQALAQALLRIFGTQRTSWALSIIGFLIAIPVFFDVGFIIMAPILFGLAKRTGRPALYFALPLLTGLAAAHAFIPPTPGPIAVAELLNANLGWVIIFGAIAAFPAALIAGPLYASWLTGQFKAKHATPQHGTAPHTTAQQSGETKFEDHSTTSPEAGISATTALLIILIPLLLIVTATLVEGLNWQGSVPTTLKFIGHPFSALMLTLIIFYTRLSTSRAMDSETLHNVMMRSLEPAAAVILVTGAGGAFKQVLVNSGAGGDIASLATEMAFSPLVFGFLAAATIRILQGSATVAMITGAGLTAPMVEAASLSAPQTALVVVVIASGATVLSHVNDSGFWLVNRYLNLSVAQTLRSWSVASTLVGLTGFFIALLLNAIISG